MRGNVMDLAIGTIIGAAFTAIVNSLVNDLFTPLLGLALSRLARLVTQMASGRAKPRKPA